MKNSHGIDIEKVEKEISITELFLHSIHIEKLLENDNLATVEDILPSYGEVIDAWYIVGGVKSFIGIQEVFVNLIKAYVKTHHTDIEDFENILVKVIFSNRIKNRDISIKALGLLVPICNDSLINVLDSVNAYQTFSETMNEKNEEIIFLYSIIIELLMNNKNEFSSSLFEIIKIFLDYEFIKDDCVVDEDEEGEENNDEDEIKKFSLKDVLGEAFDVTNSSVNLRYSAVKLISSFCMISETISRKFFPVLKKELFYGSNDMRCFVLANLFEISYIWPDLLLIEDENGVSNLSILTKFINGPTFVTQKVAIIEICRLLINDCIADCEEVLAKLVSKYTDENTKPKLNMLLLTFFKKYHSKKTKHQEEIGNTIITIMMDNFDEEKGVNTEILDQIYFLLTIIQPRFYSKIVENIQTNIKNVFQVDVGHTEIREWLNLK